EAVLLHVANYAYDGHPVLPAIKCPSPADRIFRTPVVPRERLIDHRNQRRLVVVAVSKHSSGYQRHANCFEVIGSDGTSIGLKRRIVGLARPAFNFKRVVVWSERYSRRIHRVSRSKRRAQNTWLRFDIVQ